MMSEDWEINYRIKLQEKLVNIYGKENPASNPVIYLSLKEISISDLGISIPEIRKKISDQSLWNSYNITNNNKEAIIIFNLKKINGEPFFFSFEFEGIFGIGHRFVLAVPKDRISESENVFISSESFLSLKKEYVKLVLLKNFSFHSAYIAKFNLNDKMTKETFDKIKSNEIQKNVAIIESKIGVDAERLCDQNKDKKIVNKEYQLMINWFEHSTLYFLNADVDFKLLKNLNQNVSNDDDVINEVLQSFNNSTDFKDFYKEIKKLVTYSFGGFYEMIMRLGKLSNELEKTTENQNPEIYFYKEFHLFLHLFTLLLQNDPEFTDGGRALAFVSQKNNSIEKLPINIDELEMDEINCFWKKRMEQIKWNLNDLLTNGGVPATGEIDTIGWKNFQPTTNSKYFLNKAKDILLEAIALKKWAIPFGAILEFKIGPFDYVELYEINKDVYFVFRTSENRYQIENICPSDQTFSEFHPINFDFERSELEKKLHKENKILSLSGKDQKDSLEKDQFQLNQNEELFKRESSRIVEKYINISSAWVFLCCCVIRDFFVVEEREKVFDHKIERTTKSGKNYNDGKARIVYVPRVKYNYLNSPKKTSEKVAGKGIKKSAHLVSPHLRKVGLANKFQIELAKKYGFYNVSDGYTFVTPHYRGTVKREIIYRSRSLLKHFYTEDIKLSTPQIPEWFKFEKDIFYYFKNLGFKVQHVAPVNNDGIDIMATKSNVEYVIQCKCQKNPVGPETIRELIGSLDVTGKDSKGILVTTSRFTNQAVKTAVRSSREIELIDGQQLYKLFKLN